MSKLVFGAGYLGARVAKLWRAMGDDVTAVTRSELRAAQFENQGMRSFVADVTNPHTLTNLPAVDCVLFSVGHDRTTAASIEDVYAGGVQNVLHSLPISVKRFIYISTTGVYGPAGGNWVDENTPTDPQREGGRASLAAEKALTQHPLGKSSVILRLAGIYGPGRIPFINELRAREPIAAPSSGHLNLIHVEDAAAAVMAAAELPSFDDGPRIYCVSDGHPVERTAFYQEVARRIGAGSPQFTAPDPASSRVARARGDRRVCNDKLLAQLSVKLAYPDYRAGLAGSLETANQ